MVMHGMSHHGVNPLEVIKVINCLIGYHSDVLLVTKVNKCFIGYQGEQESFEGYHGDQEYQTTQGPNQDSWILGDDIQCK